MGELSFSTGLSIPSKYMNQGKPLESSFHQKSLPYRPNHYSLTTNLRFHGLGPWVRKIIPGFAGFFNGFCLKSEHTPWLSHVLAKVLFSRLQKDTSRSQGLDVDSSCCMFSGLTEIPLLDALSTKTNVVLATLVASHFLIFSLQYSFEVSLQKVHNCLLLLGVLGADF